MSFFASSKYDDVICSSIPIFDFKISWFSMINGNSFSLIPLPFMINFIPFIIENQEILKSKIGIEEQITSSYLEDAKEFIGNIEDQPEIVIDIGGGAAKEFAPNLLIQLGCKVKVINENINNCTRGPDPTADNLSDLIATTSEKGIGFAFDLDGDRLVVVRKGKKQTPDVTLGLEFVFF